MLLNNHEITEEIKEQIENYLETNDNDKTMTKNLWDAAKAFLRGNYMAIKSYLKKQEKSQKNNLTCANHMLRIGAPESLLYFSLA